MVGDGVGGRGHGEDSVGVELGGVHVVVLKPVVKVTLWVVDKVIEVVVVVQVVDAEEMLLGWRWWTDMWWC